MIWMREIIWSLPMDLKIRNKPVWMTVILLLIGFILLLGATMMVSPGSAFAALGNNLCPLDWTAEINIVFSPD